MVHLEKFYEYTTQTDSPTSPTISFVSNPVTPKFQSPQSKSRNPADPLRAPTHPRLFSFRARAIMPFRTSRVRQCDRDFHPRLEKQGEAHSTVAAESSDTCRRGGRTRPTPRGGIRGPPCVLQTLVTSIYIYIYIRRERLLFPATTIYKRTKKMLSRPRACVSKRIDRMFFQESRFRSGR